MSFMWRIFCFSFNGCYAESCFRCMSVCACIFVSEFEVQTLMLHCCHRETVHHYRTWSWAFYSRFSPIHSRLFGSLDTHSAPTRSELWHVLNLCCMTYEASNAWFHMLFATRLEDTILSTQMHFIVFMYYLYALLCTSYAWIHDAYMDCTILK